MRFENQLFQFDFRGLFKSNRVLLQFLENWLTVLFASVYFFLLAINIYNKVPHLENIFPYNNKAFSRYFEGQCKELSEAASVLAGEL